MDRSILLRILPAARRHPALRALGATAFALLCLSAAAAAAVPTGRVEGKVIASDTGEPMSFVDVLLTPADTTGRRAGGMTNSDGTFGFDVPPGNYSLRVRALSYGPRVLTGIRVEGGRVVTANASLEPEALLQTEVVVEARIVQDNEKALLQQRRRAATVGDAVSAEQVRRSPDRDAGDVLRRVTGLSVESGKYVFVRGLGERYSSTEVDGVRLVSPEQNKRVVPLDMIPAQLLDHVVVQKTYSADRPGEFGGGDVQVQTRDFPGRRTFAVSFSQGYDEGTTGERVYDYRGGRRDWLGFGAGFREMPAFVRDVAGSKRITSRSFFDPAVGFPLDTIALLGRSFRNVWSPGSRRAAPNGSLYETFGDEWKVFGRPLGFVQSLNYGLSLNQQRERRREYYSYAPLFDFDVVRVTQSVQLGGLAALSYRLSPAHTVHVRSFYNRSADDEIRTYEGWDNNRLRNTRSTRLMYVEREIVTGALEGRHEFRRLLGSKAEWRLSRSSASRLQPDRREAFYEENVYTDDFTGQEVREWLVRGTGGGLTREFGDQRDHGRGIDGKWALPLRLGALGNGRLEFGGSYQEKERDAFYRRFDFQAASGSGTGAPPESLLAPGGWTGTYSGAQLSDKTFDFDNYEGGQKETAGYLTADLPLGRRLRANLGLRLERGEQLVRSFDLFNPTRTTAFGALQDTDLLPSANLAWAVTEATNLRLAASRTLSRPDLHELSTSPNIEYTGGIQTRGNPDLRRARIDNYDVRLETFPSLTEVFAVGGFYKRLHDPIERALRPGVPPIMEPVNSGSGRNAGVEVEARTSLGRLWAPLRPLFLNANFSTIASRVNLPEFATELGGSQHPLQGQADHLVNVALGYATPGARAEFSVLVSRVGHRLEALGVLQPDVYEEPVTLLDASVNWKPLPFLRAKLSGRNLLDAEYRATQGRFEVSRYRPGRSFSVGLSYGS